MAIPTVYPVPPAPVPQENPIVQDLSMPLFQARGWMKFFGIVQIIAGALNALTIVGIIFAWLPIWMGVLLFQAGSKVEAAGHTGDRNAFLGSMDNLKTYFIIQGVIAIIGLAILAGAICLVATTGALTGRALQNIINNLNQNLPRY